MATDEAQLIGERRHAHDFRHVDYQPVGSAYALRARATAAWGAAHGGRRVRAANFFTRFCHRGRLSDYFMVTPPVQGSTCWNFWRFIKITLREEERSNKKTTVYQ